MLIEGSCHCGAVKFSVRSTYPYPFNVCYCSICRKTAGSSGSAINLGAEAQSLKIAGEDNLGTYQAQIVDDETGKTVRSQAERKFCKKCGSHLWVWDPRWPELLHPHAGAIDTSLPIPPEHTHLMLGNKPEWVDVNISEGDKRFDKYPDESIAKWHQRLALEK